MFRSRAYMAAIGGGLLGLLGVAILLTGQDTLIALTTIGFFGGGAVIAIGILASPFKLTSDPSGLMIVASSPFRKQCMALGTLMLAMGFVSGVTNMRAEDSINLQSFTWSGVAFVIAGIGLYFMVDEPRRVYAQFNAGGARGPDFNPWVVHWRDVTAITVDGAWEHHELVLESPLAPAGHDGARVFRMELTGPRWHLSAIEAAARDLWMRNRHR
ncbi:MAG TPA: hypothetical protein PLS69_02550 [Terricaulis sp.]|nr:hypothetical protein [Terricaulis sp.]HRP10214.1 hypothetical protein [Terricaulis sp.]